ncbi:hypothetical protein PMAYCL1PPCAC_07290, partial [Pristionchus mayeri]
MSPSTSIPIAINSDRLSQWRSRLTTMPISSPFTRIPVVRETLHETLLSSIERHSKEEEGRIALINVTYGDSK